MEFPRTRWTLILSCRDKPELQARVLAELLQDYWQPLYQTLRMRGHDAAAAEDAVQGFAVQLLERDSLQRLDPAKGKLRAYLKTALLNYLETERQRQGALKRGGGVKLLSIDLSDSLSESRSVSRSVSEAVATSGDPEREYQRGWARKVMSRAVERLRVDYQENGRSGPFELVAHYFSGEEMPPYSQLAAQHQMTPVQLKAFLHRARERFRTLLRAEIADTVQTPEEIEGELLELVQAL